MLWAMSESGESIVLRFFVAANGNLTCRAIDVETRKTWVVPQAAALRALLTPQGPEEPPVTQGLSGAP